jgi:ribosome-associated protein
MERISRTSKKRMAEALQLLGKKLVKLSDGQLERLDIPERLKAAVESARAMNIKHEAYRRQIQYIGRLMRELDAAQIESALEQGAPEQDREKRRFAIIERWRDELVAGDGQRLAWIVEHVAGADPVQLNRLVADARGSNRPGGAKAARRKLFRYLSGLEIGV